MSAQIIKNIYYIIQQISKFHIDFDYKTVAKIFLLKSKSILKKLSTFSLKLVRSPPSGLLEIFYDNIMG